VHVPCRHREDDRGRLGRWSHDLRPYAGRQRERCN
jgi:hypothetical protein